MPAVTVRECWNAMNAWSRARAASEVQSFTKRQPIVSACVLAYLEDDGQDAVGVGLQIALAVDGYYTRALGRPPSRVKPRVMDKALDDAEHALEQLVGVEPTPALRRSLFERDMTAPEIVVELIELIMAEAEGDPALGPAAGAIFTAARAVALAYERANGLESPKASLGAAIEARIGGPLPRIGRNDPCACGSGRKFKKCCGTAEPPPPPPALGRNRAEQLFADYLKLVEGAMIFLNVVFHEKDGRWLRRQNRTFEKQFRPGRDGGVPDSLHTSWLLFDLRLPSSGKTVGELFLERHGPGLLEPGPTHLRHLCASYAAFYEVIGLLPDRGQKRVRELVTGVEWVVSDVEDPEAREGAPGDVWLCRLVGPREDAVTFMTPLLYPPEAREGLAKMTAFLLGSAPGGEAPLALKRASWFLAEYLVAAQKPELSFPRLANTDGDPLLATTLVYEIDSAAAAFETLADPEWPEKARRMNGRRSSSPSTPSCSARSRSTSPATTGGGWTWRSPHSAGRRRERRSRPRPGGHEYGSFWTSSSGWMPGGRRTCRRWMWGGCGESSGWRSEGGTRAGLAGRRADGVHGRAMVLPGRRRGDGDPDVRLTWSTG